MVPRVARIDGRLLRLVQSRTGASENAIVETFSQSPSFRSLCSDLKVCHRAYRDWSAGQTAEARSRASEYALLLADLEEEVRTVLSSRPLRPGNEELESAEKGEEHAGT